MVAATVSLRLDLLAAMTVRRTVIHYRSAALLSPSYRLAPVALPCVDLQSGAGVNLLRYIINGAIYRNKDKDLKKSFLHMNHISIYVEIQSERH